MATVKMRGTINNAGRAQIKTKKIKFCNKCKENHPVEVFGPDLERTDGLSNKCSKRLWGKYGARF